MTKKKGALTVTPELPFGLYCRYANHKIII